MPKTILEIVEIYQKGMYAYEPGIIFKVDVARFILC